jgi:hypothetical protein
MGFATDQAGLAFSESCPLGARFEYRQRDPEGKVLFRVVRDFLEEFLVLARERSPESTFDHPAIAKLERAARKRATADKRRTTNVRLCSNRRLSASADYGGMSNDEVAPDGAWPRGPPTWWTS